MRRILLVTSSYPDANEGEAAAGVFVRDFAAALIEAGARAAVVAPSLSSSRVSEDGIDVYRFAVPCLPLSLLSPRRPDHWATILKTLASGSRAVSDVSLEWQPDHVLALWALPCGDWARRAARRYRLPYSTWALGSDIWVLGKVPILRTYLRSVLRAASARYADGLQLASDVERISGMPCDFLPSSRRFVCRARSNWREAPPYRLAFLGRWHTNKGVDLLLDALLQLKDADWTGIAEVRVFGGGPLEDLVRGRAKTLTALGRPVVVGGYLDTAGAAALFEWADYVLLPSRIESIPVVFSDALQADCPLIASPVGDIPRLLRDYCVGVLAQEATAPAFAAALRAALSAPPRTYSTGIADARSLFDGRTAAAKLLKHFESCR